MTDKNIYPFKIGDFECLSISDGTIIVPDTVTPRPFNPADPKSGLVMDTNCLLIQAGRRKILVDTGCGKWFGEKSGKLVANLNAAGISTSEVDTVVITHAHGDHIGANADSEGKPVFGNARYIFHRDEWQYWTEKLKATADGPNDSLSMTRHNLLSIRDRVDLIEDKATIVPGIETALVPGHTPGHVAFYSAQAHSVFTGDALFQGSIGRTDLPGGDYDRLIRSIRESLLTLPDDTVVYPGHGPSTTIGEEKQFNPFLTA